MLIKIISISLLIYLLSCILMFLFQRSFIYFPKINNITNGELINNENEIIFIKTDKYNLKSWYFNSKQNSYTIIFFHGNAGDLELRAYKANAFRELGFNYLIFSYRGFNSNPGKPNEKNIYLDAQNAMDWLKNNIPDSKIIVYGESLGTGVAVEIAKNNNISGLILESPFTSLIDMGKIQFPFLPVKIILKDKFDNQSKIAEVECPILFMHGQDDKVVPFYMSQNLIKRSKTKTNFYSPANDGHMMEFNDELKRKIKSFILSLN